MTTPPPTPPQRIITLASEPDRIWQLCRCEDCGLVEQCTPSSDFYARPGRTGLCCESCWRCSFRQEQS
jgi:hypothetical protein